MARLFFTYFTVISRQVQHEKAVFLLVAGLYYTAAMQAYCILTPP
jgi:hypothetical protein